MPSQSRLIRTLQLTNFLSYGDDTEPVELQPLNVLIGPNASGKSNLIEALALLRATPKDLAGPIREGGGVGEWLWKGPPGDRPAEITATVSYPDGIMPLRYRIRFTMVGQRFQVVDEAVENELPLRREDKDVLFFYRHQCGQPVLNAPSSSTPPGHRRLRELRPAEVHPEQSILSQRRDPIALPEITYLGRQFYEITLYRDWDFGRHTPPRRPQQADLPEDFLLEDASNLALVANDLEHRHIDVWNSILDRLKRFFPNVKALGTNVYGGTIRIYIHEQDLAQPIPGSRLSDGTLRYLSLLTILCHPSPPPVVCFEEPELGLHPDILSDVAELLVEASQRTQLIVTTHSDVLVSGLSEHADSVIVCERGPTGSVLRRLDADRLKDWLDKYTLGELWTMGEIGGNLW